jgi:arylsulfatase A-like enzyme
LPARLQQFAGADTSEHPVDLSTDQGFDYFYGHNAFQIPTNHNPINIYRNGELLEAQEGYTADLYADETIAWLQKQDSATPFFLYLSMAEPHTTFENPAAYNEMYSDYTDGEIVPIPSGLDRIPTETLVPRRILRQHHLHGRTVGPGTRGAGK